jgi:hypothetical protein
MRVRRPDVAEASFKRDYCAGLIADKQEDEENLQ